MSKKAKALKDLKKYLRQVRQAERREMPPPSQRHRNTKKDVRLRRRQGKSLDPHLTTQNMGCLVVAEVPPKTRQNA